MSAKSFVLNKRRQGNITVESEAEGIAIILYNTTVCYWYRNTGEIRLRSGGWRTRTTLVAINRALRLFGTEFHVYQRDHVWYVSGIPFTEGMGLPGTLLEREVLLAAG